MPPQRRSALRGAMARTTERIGEASIAADEEAPAATADEAGPAPAVETAVETAPREEAPPAAPEPQKAPDSPESPAEPEAARVQVSEAPSEAPAPAPQKKAPRTRGAATGSERAARDSAPTTSEVAPLPPALARIVEDGDGTQPDYDIDLVHIRTAMARGRDQSDYFAKLPKPTGRGTNVRLPPHLQDILKHFCDPIDAPIQELVAVVLDAFFRDLGALPPLGEGHRPKREFFDALRQDEFASDY